MSTLSATLSAHFGEPLEIETKACKICKEEKPLDKFYNHKAYKDGKVVFGGFPDAETGNFTYLDGSTDQLPNKSKPVYYVYREDGSYFAYQF